MLYLWTKGCILPFPKNSDLGITKNYRGITLTVRAVEVYNTLLLNSFQPEANKILREKLKQFLEKSIHKFWIAVLFVYFFKIFDSIQKKKNRANSFSICSPPRKCYCHNHTLQNTKATVYTPDGDTNFLDIFAGVLHGDTLAPFLFIISLDYVQLFSFIRSIDVQKSIRFNDEHGLLSTGYNLYGALL